MGGVEGGKCDHPSNAGYNKDLYLENNKNKQCFFPKETAASLPKYFAMSAIGALLRIVTPSDKLAKKFIPTILSSTS